MVYENIEKVRWIGYVKPYKNSYTQAQVLLQENEVAGLYVFIDAMKDYDRAARLHKALDKYVRRELSCLRSPAWLPLGIMTCTTSCICVQENYVCEKGKKMHIPVSHVMASGNPDQAEQILRSGIASHRFILVRAVDQNKRAMQLAEGLISDLNDAMGYMFLGPERIICPAPYGIMMYTTRCLRIEHNYGYMPRLPSPP